MGKYFWGDTEPEHSEERAVFEEKFKPKKTTDECYTPPYIYEAVKDWAVNEYGLQGREIVRPFYPGGDYENYTYPENGVVIDNPPFSILAKIRDFYISKKIDFFLFAPGLTVLGTVGTRQANAIITNTEIIYDNGAKVKTAFITNMGEYKIHVCPELYEAINTAQKENLNNDKVTLPKYEYPVEVLTAATIQKIASKGQELKIKADDCYFIRALDAQRPQKSIYGGGFLLSEKAAVEKAAAEKAAVEKAAAEKAAAVPRQVWSLSEEERKIVRSLE